MAGLGLSLTDLFALKAAGAVDPANDVNCICLFLVGAPSQLDTWDMKPDAPSEVRGPFKAIKTNVPGIQISEIFPRMAQHADKFALIRSVHYAGVARARRRAPGDADGPAVPGRHRVAARRLDPGLSQGAEERHPAARAAAAPDRQHRRQHAARPDGRVPRQARTTRSSWAPTRRIPRSRCPTCCRRTTSRRFAPTSGASCATWWTGRCRTSKPTPTPGCSTPRSIRPTR